MSQFGRRQEKPPQTETQILTENRQKILTNLGELAKEIDDFIENEQFYKKGGGSSADLERGFKCRGDLIEALGELNKKVPRRKHIDKIEKAIENRKQMIASTQAELEILQTKLETQESTAKKREQTQRKIKAKEELIIMLNMILEQTNIELREATKPPLQDFEKGHDFLSHTVSKTNSEIVMSNGIIDNMKNNKKQYIKNIQINKEIEEEAKRRFAAEQERAKVAAEAERKHKEKEAAIHAHMEKMRKEQAEKEAEEARITTEELKARLTDEHTELYDRYISQFRGGSSSRNKQGVLKLTMKDQMDGLLYSHDQNVYLQNQHELEGLVRVDEEGAYGTLLWDVAAGFGSIPENNNNKLELLLWDRNDAYKWVSYISYLESPQIVLDEANSEKKRKLKWEWLYSIWNNDPPKEKLWRLLHEWRIANSSVDAKLIPMEGFFQGLVLQITPPDGSCLNISFLPCPLMFIWPMNEPTALKWIQRNRMYTYKLNKFMKSHRKGMSFTGLCVKNACRTCDEAIQPLIRGTTIGIAFGHRLYPIKTYSQIQAPLLAKKAPILSLFDKNGTESITIGYELQYYDIIPPVHSSEIKEIVEKCIEKPNPKHDSDLKALTNPLLATLQGRGAAADSSRSSSGAYASPPEKRNRIDASGAESKRKEAADGDGGSFMMDDDDDTPLKIGKRGLFKQFVATEDSDDDKPITTKKSKTTKGDGGMPGNDDDDDDD